MKRSDILLVLGEVIHAQFGAPSPVVAEASVIEDFPDWDSIAHVEIVVAVESRFGIRFSPEEFTDFGSIAELIDRIMHKLPAGQTLADETEARPPPEGPPALP